MLSAMSGYNLHVWGFPGFKGGSSFKLQYTGLIIKVTRILVLEILEGSNRARGWVTLLSRFLGWDVYKIWECPII